MPDLSQDFIILVPMKAIRSLASFYLGFLPAAWLLTLICIGSFHWLYPVYGWGPFMYFFWFKVLSMGLVWYATNQYRRQTYYYYRSEEHTSELQSLMRISYAVFCLNKKINYNTTENNHITNRHQ